MSNQIAFFYKNKADHSYSGATATASENSDYAPYVLNRNNTSGWITDGSIDSNNTTLTVELGDIKSISEILLIKHNFKSYTVKYWDGSTYQDFALRSTGAAIDVTGNTTETTWHSVTEVLTTKIQVTIRGTMTVDDDKHLYQFIATELIGQLNGWPVIENPTHDRNLRTTRMLSGKANVSENLGAFGCELTVKEWRSDSDLAIVEELFLSNEGFLTWLSGGSESQFFSTRIGYRLEDIYLMKCVNPYQPEFVSGMYTRGLNIRVQLAEVID